MRRASAWPSLEVGSVVVRVGGVVVEREGALVAGVGIRYARLAGALSRRLVVSDVEH